MISSGMESAPRPQGQLTDQTGLGVLAARYDRDLLEEVLNRTGWGEAPASTRIDQPDRSTSNTSRPGPTAADQRVDEEAQVVVSSVVGGVPAASAMRVNVPGSVVASAALNAGCHSVLVTGAISESGSSAAWNAVKARSMTGRISGLASPWRRVRVRQCQRHQLGPRVGSR